MNIDDELEEYDYLYAIVCHDTHWTLREITEYASKTLGEEIHYTTMSRMMEGFAITKCGSRRRLHRSGKPSGLYPKSSVRKLVEIMQVYRGKL